MGTHGLRGKTHTEARGKLSRCHAGTQSHHQYLRPVYLGDDLYSRQPLCQTLIERDADFLLVAKSASHTTSYDYLSGLRLLSKTVTQRRPGNQTDTDSPGMPDSMVVGALHPDHLPNIEKLVGQGKERTGTMDVSAAIILRRNVLDHLQRDLKTAGGKALSAEEVAMIPDVLRKPKALIIHHTENPKDRALLYVFDPVDKPDMAAKIAVRVNFRGKARTFPKSLKHVNANWIATAGYVDKRNLKGNRMELIAGSLDD